MYKRQIKLLAEPVLNHRLILTAEAQFAEITVQQVIDQLLAQVPAPSERAEAR